MSGVAERVAAGARFLDEHEPGWWQRINVSRLNLSDSCRCIRGQLDGDADEFDPNLGFDIYPLDDDAAYDELTAEWRRVITSRHETSKAPA